MTGLLMGVDLYIEKTLYDRLHRQKHQRELRALQVVVAYSALKT